MTLKKDKLSHSKGLWNALMHFKISWPTWMYSPDFFLIIASIKFGNNRIFKLKQNFDLEKKIPDAS